MNPFFLSAALLIAAAALMLLSGARSLNRRKSVMLRLLPQSGHAAALRSGRSGFASVGRWTWKLDPEIPGLLDQMGWRRPEKRALFFLVQMGTPVLAVLATSFLYLTGTSSSDTLVPLLFVAGIAFLLPKRWLVHAVNQRRRRLGDEVATMLPLLRMLFEVGMTVEQALRVLMTDGERIMPELSWELRQVMNRVNAGLDLGAELDDMAVLLDVDELTDCVAILTQLVRQGGGALSSLASLKALLDDRRMTNLQEKVSKLSAKMSAVMVAFLFPALLIVLAGPGFSAIFSALTNLGGQ